MKSLRLVLLCSGILLLTPVAASAQAQITLFVGGNFGGDTGVSLDESITDTSQLDFGARLGLFTGGLFSLEFEYGHTPNFYGKGTVFDSSSVQDVHGEPGARVSGRARAAVPGAGRRADQAHHRVRAGAGAEQASPTHAPPTTSAAASTSSSASTSASTATSAISGTSPWAT